MKIYVTFYAGIEEEDDSGICKAFSLTYLFIVLFILQMHTYCLHKLSSMHRTLSKTDMIPPLLKLF